MAAIITCAETRQSLAATRSLGRVQVPVAVASNKRPALAMWSRYATSTFLTADPKDSQVFVENLVDELRGRYAICAFTSRDNAWWALSKYRDLLPDTAKKILPPHFSVVRSLDHEALYDFAQSLGIACVRLVPVSKDDNDELHLKKLHYPVRIRSSIALAEKDEAFINNPRLVASSKSQLLKLIDKHSWLKNGFLVSDYQAQRSLSYFGVAEKGQVLVEGFQERLNEFAPLNEVSTLTQTISPIPNIRHSAQKLLSALQWQGPFKVDFIKDLRGSFRLVSLVGRLWGSLELAIKSGVNIPLITYRLAEGTLSGDLLKNARPNIRLRWLLGDVMAKISHPSKAILDVKEMAQNFGFKSLAGLIRPKSITNYFDVLDLDDPMPFLYELQNKTWKRAMGDAPED